MGVDLIRALLALRPGATIEGMGGPPLAAAGPGLRWSAPNGTSGMLAGWRLSRVIARDLRKNQPDLVVALGAGPIGLAVLEALPGTGIRRVIHGVVPSGRSPSQFRSADLVLLTHDALGWAPPAVRADIVGHPAAAERAATEEEVRAFRGTFGLGESPLLLLRPAPREARRLRDIQRAAVAALAVRRPGLRLVLTDAVSGLRDEAAVWPGQPILLSARADPLALSLRRAALGVAEVALLVDPTETLWLAAHRLPSVVARDPGWLRVLSSNGGGDASLDLVAGSRTIPTLRGLACKPARIAAALGAVLDSPPPQQDAMRHAFARLGAGGEDPSLRAARALLDGLPQAA